MADDNQISILRQGVSRWNTWRKQNPQARVDLSEGDLARADLRGALLGQASLDYSNLSRADLSGADLRAANLSSANLVGAILAGANLSDALLEETNLYAADLSAASLCDAMLKGSNLTRAKLRAACLVGCDLRGANATRADLRDADMVEANLCETDLTGANLRRADLHRAEFIKSDLTETSFAFAFLGETVFAATSLRYSKGLHLCRHRGPSSLDHLTLVTAGALPEKFLCGCGLSRRFIALLPKTQAGESRFPFYFIRYDARDAAFAQRLHDELQAIGVRCWRIEPSPIPGRQVEVTTRLGDMVLLCCSKSSLSASCLDNEIQRALMKEERTGRKSKAFMVLDLDGSLSDPAWSDWKKLCLRSRTVFDFQGWRVGGLGFKKQVRRLVAQLRS